MYKFLVWTAALSLAPVSMTGILLGAAKQSGQQIKPDPVQGSFPIEPTRPQSVGGLQDRKVISTGAEVWQGIERRSAGRRTPDALHNALYTTGACQPVCADIPASSSPRDLNTYSF